MTDTNLTPPIDIQAKLDEWLASNPDAQKYVSKLYYVPSGGAVPEDATHVIELYSAVAEERTITIAGVVVPQYAVMLDALLALVATQPPA